MLRDYQRWAAASALIQTALGRRPCLVLPTGSGKSHVIAAIAAVYADSGRRVLVTAHTRELVRQTAAKLASSGAEYGVYCAGLGQRNNAKAITVATPQSIIRAAKPVYDLLIIDEAHRIPPWRDSIYRRLLTTVTRRVGAHVIGLTATPFRADGSPIVGPEGVFDVIAYEARIRVLTAQGWLARLTSASPSAPCLDGLRRSKYDYARRDLEIRMATDRRVANTVRDIIARAENRKKILVFACGVNHALKLCAEFARRGVYADRVDYTMGAAERDLVLRAFAGGDLRVLITIETLTTGYDAPYVDCVAMVRPTLSPVLYAQMVGRGLRPWPKKQDCLVLDYGGNIARHGPIDELRAPGPSAADHRGGNSGRPAGKSRVAYHAATASPLQVVQSGPHNPKEVPLMGTSETLWGFLLRQRGVQPPLER